MLNRIFKYETSSKLSKRMSCTDNKITHINNATDEQDTNEQPAYVFHTSIYPYNGLQLPPYKQPFKPDKHPVLLSKQPPAYCQIPTPVVSCSTFYFVSTGILACRLLPTSSLISPRMRTIRFTSSSTNCTRSFSALCPYPTDLVACFSLCSASCRSGKVEILVSSRMAVTSRCSPSSMVAANPLTPGNPSRAGLSTRYASSARPLCAIPSAASRMP